MAVSVVMPALEMAQETGKLLSWRKKEGDAVVKGEPLLEIETDKAVVEIEAPADGILAAVSAHEGAVVPVGRTIAWLVQPGETPPVEAEPAVSGRQMSGGDGRVAAQSAAVASQDPAAAPSRELRISPKARRLARDQGIDISRLQGSGPDGEILAEDILKAGAGRPDLEAPTSIGRLMAERTLESWTTVPHFFLTRDVEATALATARAAGKSGRDLPPDVSVTHTDLLVALTARVLAKHPRMNGSWTKEGVRINADVNVAIAMAVDQAVVTGVIQHADRTPLVGIAARRKELAERARAGKLQPSDIAGATFTVSNLGMYHVDRFTAIIVTPQAGILAVGAIADRVVAIDGAPSVRPMMTLTLSCDHRIVDGARGALFLEDLVRAIASPGTLLD